MRGKRSKQYRKLMQQYGLAFGFREPYQVLIDAEMVQDASRFSMDLVPALSRTLHGRVKPMMTQCSMRHLYLLPTTTDTVTATTTTSASTSPPSDSSAVPAAPVPQSIKAALIAHAQTFERRRCGHHTLDAPLSALACLRAVVDERDTGANRHRYVLASQDVGVRRWARTAVRGVPSVYVRRSVMVMEPMAAASVGARDGVERGKLRGGVREGVGRTKKRTREDGEGLEEGEGEKKKARKAKGPKGPNPLSVKKAKVRLKHGAKEEGKEGGEKEDGNRAGEQAGRTMEMRVASLSDEISGHRRKRKRKHAGASTEETEMPMAQQNQVLIAS